MFPNASLDVLTDKYISGTSHSKNFFSKYPVQMEEEKYSHTFTEIPHKHITIPVRKFSQPLYH
jgi:hypothetical protein